MLTDRIMYTERETNIENVMDTDKIIDEVVRKVIKRFKIVGHEQEDLYQQSYMYALELLKSGKYDSSRKLENFLSGHIRKRLLNLVRKYYARLERPCKCCDVLTEQPCKKYKNWFENNNRKKKLANAMTINDSIEKTVDFTKDIENEELLNYIKVRIPGGLLNSFIKHMNGETINKGTLAKIINKLKEILKGTSWDLKQLKQP